MKEKTHPDFNIINITCACGTSFESGSTAKAMKVEVCSGCHPFFTGTQRFVDTMGRVERFQAKIDRSKQDAEERAAKKKPGTKAAKKAEEAKPADA